MRWESVHFAGHCTSAYQRLADVLLLSMAACSPASNFRLRHVAPDAEHAALAKLAHGGCKQHWVDNARKALHHTKIIQEAKDGELLGLIDADTMVLRELDFIEQIEFDVAYTVRPPGAAWKLNTGVYFVRVSPAVRQFAELWFSAVRLMLAVEKFHDEWRRVKQYGGIHQAALGFLLESWPGRHGLRFVELPCETWNCVPSVIDAAPMPKIVHVMGPMREWCFGRSQPPTEAGRRLVEVWQGFDRTARGQEAKERTT